MFGPNYVTVQVNNETGKAVELQVYPDVCNPELKNNGLPMHYYFVPQEVYLAKKADFPEDFDFAMTVFKGLMTSETTIGVNDSNTTDGTVEAGGGFCTFSTTFAIPPSVIQNAKQKLKQKEYHTDKRGPFAMLFEIGGNDPEPELGMVTIIENNVTVEIPDLVKVGNAKMPFFIDAQGNGKGSIEASGISSFLVTCNQMAAGAIGGSLKAGMSPFTVHYNLKQQFYINACHVEIDVDVDKVFDQVSGALSAGGFLGISSASLSFAYESCVTSGAISTKITMNGAPLEGNADFKKMIDTQIEDMRKQAFELVKKEIFDWTPTEQPPATADRGFFGSLFGGASVSVKANY